LRGRLVGLSRFGNLILLNPTGGAAGYQRYVVCALRLEK
jgi:hypothetical protein